MHGIKSNSRHAWNPLCYCEGTSKHIQRLCRAGNATLRNQVHSPVLIVYIVQKRRFNAFDCAAQAITCCHLLLEKPLCTTVRDCLAVPAYALPMRSPVLTYRVSLR
eukprot:2963511-Rhodomonas_salina.3